VTGGVARPGPLGTPGEARTAPPFRVVVAIPVYNNRRTVLAVVDAAVAEGWPVVVVDDGSDDGSGDAAATRGVTVLRHERNRGKGAALLTAARWIRANGGTHMICLDADGQFDVGDVGRIREAVERNQTAIVYGVRRFIRGDAPRASVFGRSFSNFWAWATTGRRVLDSQCGLRGYPVGCLLALGIRKTRFDFEVEALVRGVRAGLDVVPVPVSVTYRPHGGRVTHFRPVLDNMRISRSYFHLVLSGLLPLPRPLLVHDGSGDPARLAPLGPLKLMSALLSESSSPRQLAAAVAVGLLLATLPLIGFHTLAIVFAATLLRLNRVATLSAAQLCAPPFVPAVCLEVGHLVLRGRWLSEFNAETLWRQVDQRIVDYLVGTAVVAPPLALAGGAVTLIMAILTHALHRRVRRTIKGDS